MGTKHHSSTVLLLLASPSPERSMAAFGSSMLWLYVLVCSGWDLVSVCESVSYRKMANNIFNIIREPLWPVWRPCELIMLKCNWPAWAKWMGKKNSKSFMGLKTQWPQVESPTRRGQHLYCSSADTLDFKNVVSFIQFYCRFLLRTSVCWLLGLEIQHFGSREMCLLNEHLFVHGWVMIALSRSHLLKTIMPRKTKIVTLANLMKYFTFVSFVRVSPF